MRAAFGQDFSGVRVHADARAGEAALGLGAEAFTYGRSIVFAPGYYQPQSAPGRELIAHELGHIVEQYGGAARVQRQQIRRAEALDAAYELYLSPEGTRYHPSSGRYELSQWDLGHLVRRGGFYFIVTEHISLITPPEVRRAARPGAPGAGVLLPISADAYAQITSAPDATVARIVRDQLGVTVSGLTHATGAARDFATVELPAPMTRALAEEHSRESAEARRQAAAAPQAPTLDIASRRREDLPIHEIGWTDRIDQATVLTEMSGAQRAEWYVQRLGPYQAQLYASARRHGLPTQLLAVVILNELGDINVVDVVQSGEDAQWGSLGIAQIQVTTAMTENLVDVTPAEAEDAYRGDLARRGQSTGGGLTEYERRVGRRLRTARQLQVPQVAIEAAAREVEMLLNRMAANRNAPWQRQFQFRAAGAGGDAVYGGIGPQGASAEQREGMLAMLVTGSYNSPNIIDTGNTAGFRNALVHGQHGRMHAVQLYRFGLFRATEPAAPVAANPAAPAAAQQRAPITGLRFDGSQLTLFGGRESISVRAVSGVRANNPHNPDHHDHTGPASQTMPNVGPTPEGDYFINPGEVETGYQPGVWGPIRVRIHGEPLTDLRRWWSTHRTGGFYLHEDVGHDGTAGCIGLQERRDTNVVFARVRATTEQIPLTVRYPRGTAPTRRP